jgi:hypothetical protein
LSNNEYNNRTTISVIDNVAKYMPGMIESPHGQTDRKLEWVMTQGKSSDAPLVTIAVPSFNQGRYLAEALESIFNQGLPVEVLRMVVPAMIRSALSKSLRRGWPDGAATGMMGNLLRSMNVSPRDTLLTSAG